MEILACGILFDRYDFRFEIRCEDLSFVMDLTAHRSVENSLVSDDDDVVACGSAVNFTEVAVCISLKDIDDLGIAGKVFVTVIFSGI